MNPWYVSTAGGSTLAVYKDSDVTIGGHQRAINRAIEDYSLKEPGLYIVANPIGDGLLNARLFNVTEGGLRANEIDD